MSRKPLLPYRTVDEIAEILATDKPKRQPARTVRRASSPRKLGAAGAKNASIVDGRKIMRRAFDLIRHDPSQIILKGKIVEAMGGRAPVTDNLLAEAREIISP